MSTTSTSGETPRRRDPETFTTPARLQFWPFLPRIRRRAEAIEPGLLRDAPRGTGLLGRLATVFGSHPFPAPPRGSYAAARRVG